MRTILIFLALTFSCTGGQTDGIQHFNIKVKDFYGADGVTLYILVTLDSIKISSDCDYADCSEKTIYRQGNDDEKINDFKYFLSSCRLDTLKSSYEDKNVEDGLFRTVTVQINDDSIKSIQLNNIGHHDIDELIKRIDILIKVDKYRIASRFNRQD